MQGFGCLTERSLAGNLSEVQQKPGECEHNECSLLCNGTCESKRWTQQLYNNNVAFISTGTIVSLLIRLTRCGNAHHAADDAANTLTPFFINDPSAQVR